MPRGGRREGREVIGVTQNLSPAVSSAPLSDSHFAATSPTVPLLHCENHHRENECLDGVGCPCPSVRCECVALQRGGARCGHGWWRRGAVRQTDRRRVRALCAGDVAAGAVVHVARLAALAWRGVALRGRWWGALVRGAVGWPLAAWGGRDRALAVGRSVGVGWAFALSRSDPGRIQVDRRCERTTIPGIVCLAVGSGADRLRA